MSNVGGAKRLKKGRSVGGIKKAAITMGGGLFATMFERTRKWIAMPPSPPPPIK